MECIGEFLIMTFGESFRFWMARQLADFVFRLGMFGSLAAIFGLVLGLFYLVDWIKDRKDR